MTFSTKQETEGERLQRGEKGVLPDALGDVGDAVHLLLRLLGIGWDLIKTNISLTWLVSLEDLLVLLVLGRLELASLTQELSAV